MMLLQVGQEFPGPVPDAPDGGAILEMREDGTLMLLILMPNPSQSETAALKEGFSHYSLYIAPDPPYVAMWVWKFAAPVMYTETPFIGSLYKDDRIERYLSGEPKDNNALTWVVLDGKVVRQLGVAGLRHDAVAMFRSTLRLQLAVGGTTQEGYSAALEKIHRLKPKELFDRGTVWRHQYIQGD